MHWRSLLLPLPAVLLLPFSLSLFWFYPFSNCHLPLHSTLRSSAKCLCNFRLKFVTIRQTVRNYAENRRKLRKGQRGERVERLIFNRIHECTYDLPRQICKTISSTYTLTQRERERDKCSPNCMWVCSCRNALCHVGYAVLSHFDE